jgi:cell wall-associated NlpC family hydrolase
VADDDDFVAVYDKKMLWRANLYVDEGDGLADWNNAHPWVYGNEWNIDYRDRDGDGNTIEPGDGGQVVGYSGFSSIRGDNRNDRVAYDYPILYGLPRRWYGAIDTPMEFQQHMECQRDAIDEWYQPGGSHNVPEGQSLPGENETTAPGNNWRYYVPASWGSYAASGAAEVDPTPYLPGLGLVTYSPFDLAISETEASAVSSDMTSGNDLHWARLMTGVDCVGFAQQVYDYGNNPYAWGPLGVNGADRAYPRAELDRMVGEGAPWGVYSVLIVGYIPNEPLDRSLYSYVKPGDIMYTRDGEGTGRHVAIVQRVDRNDDGSVEADGIHLIESTFFRQYAFVLSPGTMDGTDDISRTLANLMGNEDRFWRIVRLTRTGE